jgi:hypothetical protein
MPQSDRTFRIFVSSTFCRTNGARFQPIDLL